MPQCSVTTEERLYKWQCASYLNILDETRIHKVHLSRPQKRGSERLGSQNRNFDHLLKWISVSTCGGAFLLYLLHVFFSIISLSDLSFVHPLRSAGLFTVTAGDVSLPGPNNGVLAVSLGWCNTEIVKYPQCNWTQVKHNQSLWEQCAVHGLAWPKELQRLWRLCKCFFFSQSKQLKSTKIKKKCRTVIYTN